MVFEQVLNLTHDYGRMNYIASLSKAGRWLKLPLLLVIVAGVVWYVRSQPVAVESQVIASGTVVRSVMGTGTLEARIRTTISPKISGRIAEVLADQGTFVKAGQLLVRLDDEDLLQQVRIASAGISSSEATLGRYRAEVAQAKTTMVKNEAEMTRYRQLIQDKSVSQSEYDQAQEAFELAQSGLLKAEANLLEAEEKVALNRETLKYQEARLADSRLLAPFDGLVIERERDPGAIVVPGSPILHVISLEELWISAWVDETEMDQLEEAQPASIVFRSQPNVMLEGRVARLGKQADRETREFIVDVRILRLPEKWAVGQRAEVYIEIDRRDHCLNVPKAYLTKHQEGWGVYTKEDNVARWRSIETGLDGRESIEVLGGLEAGAVVVKPRDANKKLTDGTRITSP